jgi:hypothetical protein
MKRLLLAAVATLALVGTASASPCDDLGTLRTESMRTDPAHCKEGAAVGHLSETENVRRLRIIFARDRCKASVTTSAGQDECEIRYPMDW